MKKSLSLFVLVWFLAGALFAIESPLFAKVVVIQKITSHEKGYRVVYYSAHGDLKTVYVPIEWFYHGTEYLNADGSLEAEIVQGRGPAYPYMEIYWKNGKFHHLRLFVVNDYSDRSWGVVKPEEAQALRLKFDPSKPPELQF